MFNYLNCLCRVCQFAIIVMGNNNNMAVNNYVNMGVISLLNGSDMRLSVG